MFIGRLKLTKLEVDKVYRSIQVKKTESTLSLVSRSKNLSPICHPHW